MPYQPIYLDNSTTTKPSEKSVMGMMPFFTDMWGIPSAPHQKGQILFPAILESFKNLYKLIGAKEEDLFVFTSSGAESVNHVIHSVYRETTLTTGKNQFLTSSISEAPSIMAMEQLEGLGCISKMIEVNASGIVTVEALAESISPRTALVSLPWANGLTGVIQPLTEIIELCQQRGILLHLEASHILGKLFFDLEDLKIDFLTFNGDHLHAPKGTGGLYVKNGVRSTPFIVGSTNQGAQRSGPLNVPSLVALGIAAKESMESQDYLCTEIARLRNKLENGILQKISTAIALFQDQERLPHCTTISFPGLTSEALLFELNRKGVFACIGGGSFQQLGLLLETCKISELISQGAISFSLSRYTQEEEIDRAIILIAETAELLLKMSKKILEES